MPTACARSSAFRRESIPDFLALVGNSADGYPGIPGWGKVSPATVLTRYGHLEDIPESVSDWDITVRGAADLGHVTARPSDEAFLFRELAHARQGRAAAGEARRPALARRAPRGVHGDG